MIGKNDQRAGGDGKPGGVRQTKRVEMTPNIPTQVVGKEAKQAPRRRDQLPSARQNRRSLHSGSLFISMAKHEPEAPLPAIVQMWRHPSRGSVGRGRRRRSSRSSSPWAFRDRD